MSRPLLNAAQIALNTAFNAVSNHDRILFLSEECERLIRTTFLFAFEPAIEAVEAASHSRAIALQQLERTIGEGVDWLIDSGLRSETDDDKRDMFNALVKPWIDRLKS